MKALLLILGIICIHGFLFAQNTYLVKGMVTDTASNIKLANATVSILNSKDSVLVKFTRAGANGTFSMNNFTKGKFILLISYPSYADYVEVFRLDSAKKELDFGRINLRLKSRILAEVLIKGTAAAIKIKGDTTEFNAAAFKIQPNSKVEDLLKQLPGIQVDKDGKITAQGQTVNKVLVDGEEFFGDDPTLVTKNIRGDMVDKVQLYDKKSDQATFTGIDDGVKNKTINIKLKEDKKNGYFGKIDAGVASNKYYQGQGMVNIFKAKQKFSAYGTIGNTGKTGLGWQDNSKYASSNNIEFMDGGGIMITSNGRDELESFDGRYNGRGIPLARSGGLHYDTKWNKDKESLNTNYKIGSIEVNGTNNTITQNNLPSGVQNNNSDQSFRNYMFRQKLDATYQIKLDSSSNLKVVVDGTLKNNETRNNYSTTSYRGFDTLLNRSNRSLVNNGNEKILDASAFYTKKLKKAGRTVSVSLSTNYDKNEAKGYLNSTINFYNKAGGTDSTQLINQYKTSNTTSSIVNSNITYSEPFTKAFSVIVNYGLGINNSSADRKSFDQSVPGGDYTILNSVLSNNYKFNQLSNQVGAIFNYKKGKGILNFGTKATGVKFEQANEYTNTSFKRNFLNWNPQASYQYKFSQQKSLYLNYNGRTTQPTIDQIQPVLVNTDPLNVTLGNPNLKPSFNNSLSLNYNSYKVLSEQYIYVNLGYGLTSNAIVNNTVTDATGKTTYQSSNLLNKSPSYFYLYSYIGRKLKKLDFNVGFNINTNGNVSYNYTNSALNKTRSNTYAGQLDLSKYKDKKYDVNLRFGPTYTVSGSSLQQNINNNGFGLNGNGSFRIDLPYKFEVSFDGNYEYRAKTQAFNQNFERLLLNAAFSKKFLKQDNLKFTLSGNDLLNQNVGFERNAYGGMITQNSYTTIRRYFMFSVIYDFNKMGGVKTTK